MEYCKLKGGIEIPMIGYGPDALDGLHGQDRSLSFRVRNKLYKKFVSGPRFVKAIAKGINFGGILLDWSAAYGNGDWLARGIVASGVKREKLYLTTRVSNNAQYRDSIEIEFQEQLRSFRTDYFDILMFHWPVTDHYEQTWLKMLELKKKGLCRILGVANCNIHHLQRLYEVSGEYPEINQFEMHPLFIQEKLRQFCQMYGIQVEAYSPTARHDDRLFNPVRLKELAAKYNKSITQLILRWQVQHGVIPVIRSLNPAHLASDFDIFDFDIDVDDMKKIDGMNINSRIRYDPDNCDFRCL